MKLFRDPRFNIKIVDLCERRFLIKTLQKSFLKARVSAAQAVQDNTGVSLSATQLFALEYVSELFLVSLPPVRRVAAYISAVTFLETQEGMKQRSSGSEGEQAKSESHHQKQDQSNCFATCCRTSVVDLVTAMLTPKRLSHTVLYLKHVVPGIRTTIFLSIMHSVIHYILRMCPDDDISLQERDVVSGIFYTQTTLAGSKCLLETGQNLFFWR